MEFVDPAHERFGFLALTPRLIVQGRTIEPQQGAVPAYRLNLVIQFDHFPKLGN
jgi:hypothetical protein